MALTYEELREYKESLLREKNLRNRKIIETGTFGNFDYLFQMIDPDTKCAFLWFPCHVTGTFIAMTEYDCFVATNVKTLEEFALVLIKLLQRVALEIKKHGT